MIPPEADAEFVAHLELILDTHEKPYDPAVPVVNRDEQSVPLLKEIRQPLPAAKTQAKRVDDEYERAGTASMFLFTEPLAGWREVTVRERRTKIDWAVEVARLPEGRDADCAKVILVCDNQERQANARLAGSLAPPAHGGMMCSTSNGKLNTTSGALQYSQ